MKKWAYLCNTEWCDLQKTARTNYFPDWATKPGGIKINLAALNLRELETTELLKKRPVFLYKVDRTQATLGDARRYRRGCKLLILSDGCPSYFFFTVGLKSWFSGNSLFCRTICTSPEGVRKISPGGRIERRIFASKRSFQPLVVFLPIVIGFILNSLDLGNV